MFIEEILGGRGGWPLCNRGNNRILGDEEEFAKYTAEEGVIFLDVASLEVYFFLLHIIRQISRKRNILNFIEN